MRFHLLPTALIVLGVTLLLANLGIVPKEEIRDFVHTWWPLLLVAIGAAMLVRPRGVCGHRRCGPRRGEAPDEADAVRSGSA